MYKNFQLDKEGFVLSSKHFTRKELECHRSGACKMDKDFMEVLEKIRELYGKPIRLSSAYRTWSTGAHTLGKAVDVLVHGSDALKLLTIALECGITGVGVSQKGSKESRFLHLDTWDNRTIRPNIWSY